jgi:hypothetical protein
MHKPVVVASVATWIRATICARASVAAAFRMVEKYSGFYWISLCGNAACVRASLSQLLTQADVGSCLSQV